MAKEIHFTYKDVSYNGRDLCAIFAWLMSHDALQHPLISSLTDDMSIELAKQGLFCMVNDYGSMVISELPIKKGLDNREDIEKALSEVESVYVKKPDFVTSTKQFNPVNGIADLVLASLEFDDELTSLIDEL